MPTFNKSITSVNIKSLRKRKGLTQQQLADYLGHKSDTIVSNWETGRTEPGWKDVEKMAKLFGVKPEKIVEESKIEDNPGSNLRNLTEQDRQDMRGVFSAALAQDQNLKEIVDLLKQIVDSGLVSCPYAGKNKAQDWGP